MIRFYALLFATVFFFTTLFSSGTIDSLDGFLYLNVARSLVREGNVSVEPNRYATQENIHMNVFVGADGQSYSPTGLGYSLALVPAAWISSTVHTATDTPWPQNFPLEPDWVIQFAASFTNSVFAAIIVCLLVAYLRRLGFSLKTALFFSLIGFYTTNLFPYAKHSFAHLMFAAFLLASFYFVRSFADTKKPRSLFLTGLSFGIFGLTYNPVFILAFPFLLLYFFLLIREKKIALTLSQVLVFVTGAAPSAVLYLAYAYVKTADVINSGYGLPSGSNFINTSSKYVFEGLWGFLFSSGRSIFLYSPLLLYPVIFWQSLAVKKFRSEILTFLLMCAFFLYFYAIQMGGPDWLVWHGESSWGPRYLTFLIPYGVLLVAMSFQETRFRWKKYTLAVLIAAGVYVQTLGVLLPYQINFRGLPLLEIAGKQVTQADYGNFLPRYSPLVSQPRQLFERFQRLPQSFHKNEYGVELREGFGLPFWLGDGTAWRDIEDTASLEWDENVAVKNIELRFTNIVMADSTSSARITLKQNDEVLSTLEVPPQTEESISVSPQAGIYHLVIDKTYVATGAANQVVLLQALQFDGNPIAIDSYTYPFGEVLTQKLTNSQYRTYDLAHKNDRWKLWHSRSRLYEQSFDLWWIRSYYYWDLPHRFITGLFFCNLLAFIFSTVLFLRYHRKYLLPEFSTKRSTQLKKVIKVIRWNHK